MSIERTVSPGFLADRAAATVKEAGALASGGPSRAARDAADRAVSAVEAAGETRGFQAAAKAVGVERADLRGDVMAGRFEEVGRKLAAVAARSDLLNGTRASNDEVPKSGAVAKQLDWASYNRGRAVDLAKAGSEHAPEYKNSARNYAERARTSNAPGGPERLAVGDASVRGEPVSLPSAERAQQRRAAADAVSERQQRGAQYYADKIASAPEAPVRAQSETRAARLRVG